MLTVYFDISVHKNLSLPNHKAAELSISGFVENKKIDKKNIFKLSNSNILQGPKVYKRSLSKPMAAGGT